MERPIRVMEIQSFDLVLHEKHFYKISRKSELSHRVSHCLFVDFIVTVFIDCP